jgi:hypothetical protein
MAWQVEAWSMLNEHGEWILIGPVYQTVEDGKKLLAYLQGSARGTVVNVDHRFRLVEVVGEPERERDLYREAVTVGREHAKGLEPNGEGQSETWTPEYWAARYAAREMTKLFLDEIDRVWRDGGLSVNAKRALVKIADVAYD